jgi:hypothetical protein
VKLRFKRNQVLLSLPPELFGKKLSHLQVLSLCGCNKLQTIPPDIGKL